MIWKTREQIFLVQARDARGRAVAWRGALREGSAHTRARRAGSAGEHGSAQAVLAERIVCVSRLEWPQLGDALRIMLTERLLEYL